MKYTVLTYIFNGYEMVHEVTAMDPNAHYILVTDDPGLRSLTWDVVYDSELTKMSPMDKCYAVRFHPFRYTTDSIIVRIDGSIGIKGDLSPIVDKFVEGGYDRCLMMHPQRTTIPEEYLTWTKIRGYSMEQAEKCMAFMDHLGYDLNTRGLYEGGFEIQKKNSINAMINEIVYTFLRYLGRDGVIERIDQTITSFVINHMFPHLNVCPVSEDIITDGRHMTLYHHNSFIPIPRDENKTQPYLFGQPINTIEL